MSGFFLQRPIFAAVISIIITLLGLVSARLLPVEQYPPIAPPTVTITANYPGASAETLSKTVAAPIEEQLSGIENLLYFSSTSSSTGSLTITSTFVVGSDVNKAVIDVNNRLQIAAPRLPDVVRRSGVVAQKRSIDILLLIALRGTQPGITPLYLSNYATINLLDEFKRVNGVGDATIFSALDYAMRVWLKPDRMAQLGITPSDVVSALNAQNFQYAGGKIGAEPAPPGQVQTYTVVTSGRLLDAEEFGEIVLRAGGPDGVLRLKDVARIELGSLTYDGFNTLDGQPDINIAIYLQPGANALQVADAVTARLQELKKRFPQGVEALIPFDPTRYIRASIEEVIITVCEAAVLVVLVVFLFLQNWRATLVPAIAVPVSLIGTFAGLYAIGYAINTLTLFAMVLAIGIVVDDAIVVLENVERLMREQGLSPRDAAREAMNEVQGAVIAIVLVLVSVFLPVAFLGGIAGILYKQFAVTLAISVFLSGVVALTLTPVLCARLLVPHAGESKLFAPFNRLFEASRRRYVAQVGWSLRHRVLSWMVLVLVLAAAGYLFWRVPGSLVPPEDQGYLIANVNLPDGASLQRTAAATGLLQARAAKERAIEHVIALNGFDVIGGGNKSSAATVFLPLVPWSERSESASDLVVKLAGIGRSLTDGIAVVFSPPAIRGLGTSGGFELYLQSRASADPKRLAAVLQDFIAALNQHPKLAGVTSFFRPSVPQLRVEVDRAKAISLGIPLGDVYDALQSELGGLYVNDFNKFGRTYRVQIQADSAYRANPQDIGDLYVRGASGMVPLKALIDVTPIVGPETLDRYNNFLAAKVLGSGKSGISSGEAIAAVEEVARATLPEGFSIEWTGQAYQEKRASSTAIYAFTLAITLVYLILSALYERWRLPVAVLLAVPFALFGALALVYLRGLANDVYFQIGLVVLIGLAAKNAILIVEFAQQSALAGMAPKAAALEAARLRLRPILMTSLAFVLGVVPLVVASGAGAGARRSMGTGVFGGMLAATFFATIFIPLFFVALSRNPKPEPERPEPSNPDRAADG